MVADKWNSGIFNESNATFIFTQGTTASSFMYVLPSNAPCPADTSFINVYTKPNPLADSIIKITPIKTTITICEFLPAIINNITTTSCDSLTTSTTTLGSWSINTTTKCLEYTSSNIKGIDSICIRVCNIQTAICKETFIIININGIAPVANPDTIKTSTNSSVIIHVLSNDISYDNDTLKLCLVAINNQPLYGTTTINADGTITYIPNDNYVGIDSFQYIICDADGSDTAWIYITIGCDENDLCCDIPNAFSPNNDGINDIFRVRCFCDVAEFYLAIYNRLGNKVFESHDINIGWNGKYKNKTDQVETYGYYLEYRPTCGKNKIFRKGNVTLLE